MIKKEFKFNFKSFVIWNLMLIALFVIVYLVYPSITNSINAEQLNLMMASLPKEMLVMFNMDISNITTAYGWFKTEGLVLVTLILGVYASISGVNVVLKETQEKTEEYLLSLPVKKNKIIFNKVFPSLVYITLSVIILTIFNYIGMSISGNFDRKTFLLLSLSPLLSSYVIFFLSLLIACFTNNKNTVILSLGIVFITYILGTLSSISKSVEFLKYFSPFTLADSRNIIKTNSININYIFITIVLSIIFYILALKLYNNKEYKN